MASMKPADYEKLGQFYLGREYDLEKKSSADKNLVLYDSKDLVTHAIVVGMTGAARRASASTSSRRPRSMACRRSPSIRKAT
jgi:hypothetical protein